MGSPSIWDGLALIIVGIPNLFFIPAVRRAGFSAWWVVLSMVPVVGFLLLWKFALTKWPAQPGR